MTKMKMGNNNAGGNFFQATDFSEALTALLAVAFPKYKPEFSDRFEEGFAKSIAHKLREGLESSETSSVTLPHGTFTVENAGDVINVGFEFSKSAVDFVNGDIDKLKRMDLEDYDPRIIELFKNYIGYGQATPKELDSKSWGVDFPQDDGYALILQDISGLVMTRLVTFGKEGSISDVAVDKHGVYSLEIIDGNRNLLFEADPVFKQACKSDTDLI